MTLYELLKNHQNRKRIEEIVHVFFEEEFGYLISKIKLHHHLPFHKRIQARIAREKAIDHQVRLRKAFERLGPTFVKLGQLLSLRPDLVPPEFLTEFEKMQDQVPSFPFSVAKTILESELKKPLNKIFTSFDQKPIASASMAQVYKARIGKEIVAVKVQRPGIEQTIKEDIEIMYQIVELLEHHIPDFKEYALKNTVHEFEKWTIKELNFGIEAHYAQQIANNFKGSKILKIPKVYSGYTTSKVLTTEFLDGIPLHNIEEIRKKKINLTKVIRNGYYVILKQVFVDGFFHADPHPGNILVLKDGRIGLIDFGILGHFDKKLRRYALDLFYSFVNNEPEKAVDIILQTNPQSDIDKEAFLKDVRDIFEQLHYSSSKDLLVGTFIKETLTTAYKHRIEIPTDFVLYGRTLAIVEGLALRYQPDFPFYRVTREILTELVTPQFLAREAYDRTKSKLSKYQDVISNFPETALEIMEKAKKFKMNVDIDDADVRNITSELERSSGNLSLGFIIAALIISSALIMLAGKPSSFYWSGFSLAGILGLWLVHRTIFLKARKAE